MLLDPALGSALGVLTASLLGSAHCAGMCGPFVCFYAGSAPSHVAAVNGLVTTQSLPQAHALYNLGRLVSYLLLGALAGGFGAAITHAGLLAGIANTAGLLAGALMVAWGTYRIAVLSGFRTQWLTSWTHASSLGLATQKALGNILLQLRARSLGVRALLTGMLTTLLPCGWLYVFVVAAGGTGSAGRGMLLMFVFWLGNVPALLVVAAGAQRAFGPLQRMLPSISAVFVVVLGLIAVVGHLQMTSMVMQHAH